jgi:hypothetical protein
MLIDTHDVSVDCVSVLAEVVVVPVDTEAVVPVVDMVEAVVLMVVEEEWVALIELVVSVLDTIKEQMLQVMSHWWAKAHVGQ